MIEPKGILATIPDARATTLQYLSQLLQSVTIISSTADFEHLAPVH